MITLSLCPSVARPLRRGGRPPVSDSPAQRKRHIRAAYYRLVEGRDRNWIARKFRVSIRTLSNWIRAALSYRDPEAQALREMLEAQALREMLAA